MAFGKRKTEEPGVASGSAGGKTGLNNAGARAALLLSTLLSLWGFCILMGALASLQRRVNDLKLAGISGLAYTETLQSGNVAPYPNDGDDQLALPWWICMFELVISIVLLLLFCTARPLLRFKHAAMAFLVYVWVLITLQIDSLLFLKRSPVISDAWTKSRIKAALAGAIIGAVANGLQLLSLGLLEEENVAVGGAMWREGSFGGSKRVGVDAATGTTGTGVGAGAEPGVAAHEKPAIAPTGQQGAGMV